MSSDNDAGPGGGVPLTGSVPRRPRTLSDFILSLAAPQLRGMWNRTLSDGRERAVTMFRRPNGVYYLTPERTGTTNGVRTVPAPSTEPNRVNIHTHPVGFSTGLSVTDYHTFTRAFIEAAPHDSPPPQPAGYAVVAARNDGGADRPGPAIYALRPTRRVQHLDPGQRSRLAQEVRSAESPDAAQRILAPYHHTSAAQF